ncbi:MAG TPA: hypothetical protein VGO03_13815 [Acidimicrobiia bacterium]
MHDDHEQRSRRHLMKVALGGAAVAAAAAVTGPSAAGADDGDPVLLGARNEAPTATRIGSTYSDLFLGGNTTYTVLAQNYQNSSNVIQANVSNANSIGVLTTTSGDPSQVGVKGDTTHGAGDGISVYGISKNGVGVLAECPGGYALWVKGRAQFTRSGKLVFAKGQAAKAVTPMVFNQDSLVLATIQGNVAGLWVQGVVVDIAHSKFTINLNKPAPAAVAVGWFIAN